MRLPVSCPGLAVCSATAEVTRTSTSAFRQSARASPRGGDALKAMFLVRGRCVHQRASWLPIGLVGSRVDAMDTRDLPLIVRGSDVNVPSSRIWRTSVITWAGL